MTHEILLLPGALAQLAREHHLTRRDLELGAIHAVSLPELDDDTRALLRGQ